MKKHVVLYRKVPEDVLQSLRREFDVTAFDDVDDANRMRFVEALGSAHGIMGNTLRIGAALLEAAPRLEAASTISAGYDAFDVTALTQRGIVLTNTPDEVTETTADLVFALLEGFAAHEFARLASDAAIAQFGEAAKALCATSLMHPDRLPGSPKEIDRLYKALKARNGEEAQAPARQHVLNAEKGHDAAHGLEQPGIPQCGHAPRAVAAAGTAPGEVRGRGGRAHGREGAPLCGLHAAHAGDAVAGGL